MKKAENILKRMFFLRRFLFIFLTLMTGCAFLVNPTMYGKSKKEIEKYLADTYPELQIQKLKMLYDYKLGNYLAEVLVNIDGDEILFNVFIERNLITARDDIRDNLNQNYLNSFVVREYKKFFINNGYKVDYLRVSLDRRPYHSDYKKNKYSGERIYFGEIGLKLRNDTVSEIEKIYKAFVNYTHEIGMGITLQIGSRDSGLIIRSKKYYIASEDLFREIRESKSIDEMYPYRIGSRSMR